MRLITKDHRETFILKNVETDVETFILKCLKWHLALHKHCRWWCRIVSPSLWWFAGVFSAMSVKQALGRGVELGRSVFRPGLFRPAARVAAKLRLSLSAPPQSALPGRYRFYRLSVRGLAARLQSGGFRRLVGGGSHRNRAVFLAFGLGLGLIEQQLEEDKRSATLCQEIQVTSHNNNLKTCIVYNFTNCSLSLEAMVVLLHRKYGYYIFTIIHLWIFCHTIIFCYYINYFL